jgi:hypothetical protein
MVVQSANAAIDNANGQSTCDPGYCLKNVRTWLGIGSREADAADAWRTAIGKHPDDKHPPKGAPVFWTGGSSGHGHIALTKADKMRSTDIPSAGRVGNDDGRWPREHWGLTYVGWAEGFNGVAIPYLGQPWQASGDVWVDKLVEGTQDSDSVARLCYRLIHHPDMPGSHRPPSQVRNYGQEIVEAVRYWQRNIGDGINGPTDGSAMSNPQANALFGDAYNVIEK